MKYRSVLFVPGHEEKKIRKAYTLDADIVVIDLESTVPEDQKEKGEKYFIVKNSWGTTWGMDGYIYMSADTPNLCGIAMDACFAS